MLDLLPLLPDLATMTGSSTFAQNLIQWYLAHHRKLPFRDIRDPYRIWISEIILQQTRMEQGLVYYHRFLERFPDVRSLATASEEEVLLLWQGLGYYSRARNLHRAAHQVMDTWNGVFPSTYADILSLPGIGSYTAASVASLAFLEPVPAIDGNVYRFFARYIGLREPVNSLQGKKQMGIHLQELMDRDRPDLFNQAMIEYGALVCTPHHPRCRECFLASSCEAFLRNLTDELPVKQAKSEQRIRYFHYLMIRFPGKEGESILVRRRTSGDIWKNLYELPLIETSFPAGPEDLTESETWNLIGFHSPPVIEGSSALIRHQLSHQQLRTTFIRIRVPKQPVPTIPGYKVLPVSQLSSLPFPRLITRWFEATFPMDASIS